MESEVGVYVESDEEPLRNTFRITIDDDELDDKDESGSFKNHLEICEGLTGPSGLLSVPISDERRMSLDVEEEDCICSVLTGLFAESNRMFQPISDDNFVEEFSVAKPPKIVNGYLFGDAIGEGSYSKVKEVLQADSLVRKAVKIIKSSRLRKIPNGKANVDQELRILKRVHHHNVISLYDVFRDPVKEKLYIIMEYCIGSLQQILDGCEAKKLPIFQSHNFFQQLINGLSYLHDRGVIHKDIKPGNLLLTLDGIVKISDFGVAEMLSTYCREDWCKIVQGTPKFQPPEIVSGGSAFYRGRKVDIWASGVTLYNFISGEYPFEGDVIMHLYENIVNQPLTMPKSVDISHSLHALLSGMLEKDPEKRTNMQDIYSTEWFITSFEKDSSRITIPVCNTIPAHRPLSVYAALQQMYGDVNESDSVSNEEVPALNRYSSSSASISFCNSPPVVGTRRNKSILSLCLGSSISR